MADAVAKHIELDILFRSEACAVAKTDAGWQVTVVDGTVYTCENLVMSTPIDVTVDLLRGIDGIADLEVRNASVLYGYILEDAVPQPAFEKGVVHIFSDETPIIYIAKRVGLVERDRRVRHRQRGA